MVTLTDKELAAFDAMYNLLTGSIERCAEQITLLQQRVDSIEGAQPVSKDWLNGIYRQIDNLNIRLNQNQQKVGADDTADIDAVVNEIMDAAQHLAYRSQCLALGDDGAQDDELRASRDLRKIIRARLVESRHE